MSADIYFVRSTGEAFVVDSRDKSEADRIVKKLEARGVTYERVSSFGGVCRLRAIGNGHLDVTTIPGEGLL